jgi:SanA protein
MRRSLIELGVPDSVIVLDYAGFRTFDSMIRAKKVFGQDSITVISQAWHNERAVYIAQHYDLDAIGFNVTDIQHRRSYLKNHTREILAKTKVVLDMLLHKQPKFLGDPVPIP